MSSFPVVNFSLYHTLESGQFFSYQKDGNAYYIITPNCVFSVCQEGNYLCYDNIEEKELKHFLGLLEPYEKIIAHLSCDIVVKKYIMLNYGLRVMHLDPWQCTISFLCSSAANIPKIKSNIQKLSLMYGKKVSYDGKRFFLFPRIGSIGRGVRKTGVGFRAPFIEAANALPLSFFHNLIALPYTEAKQRLCALPGIGEKIANCILLFGYHRWEAFPIDVWMQRVLQKKYGKKNFTLRQLQLFVPALFPHYPGYAQQFLYYGFRQEQHVLK